MKASVSRNQLKEIIRKVYLKNIIKEDVDEGLKTQISNILSNFFADEKNIDILCTNNVCEIRLDWDKLDATFAKRKFITIGGTGQSKQNDTFHITIRNDN